MTDVLAPAPAAACRLGLHPHPRSRGAILAQEEMIKEAQTMKSYQHPNVLPLFTSFIRDQDLWMVMPYMSGGSILHIMKYGFPQVGATRSAGSTGSSSSSLHSSRSSTSSSKTSTSSASSRSG